MEGVKTTIFRLFLLNVTGYCICLYSDVSCNNEGRLLPKKSWIDLVIFDSLKPVAYMQNRQIFCYDVVFLLLCLKALQIFVINVCHLRFMVFIHCRLVKKKLTILLKIHAFSCAKVFLQKVCVQSKRNTGQRIVLHWFVSSLFSFTRTFPYSASLGRAGLHR